jgi:hypothetical protein
MKLKRIVLCLVLSFFSHSAKAEDNQYLEHKVLSFSAPVQTTASGFSSFLKNTYNQVEYTDFLPNNFCHIIQFLEHGKNTKQTRSYTQSVVRLFANRLKGCSYVNAQALCTMLELFPGLIQHHFVVQRANLSLLQEKINSLLYASFLDKFAEFKTNPSTFINTLSQDIVDTLSLNTHDIGDVSMEELRKTTLVFFEVALSKIIWCPDDQIDTWKSVKKVSTYLTRLMDLNIITDPDDLNDLFVTLVERYCFFIDLAGDDLLPSFYKEIKKDLATSTAFLLELEEQEALIEPKIQRLERVLARAEERSLKKHRQA